MLRRLRAIAGEGGVLSEDGDAAPYLVDLTKRYHGTVIAVVRPRSTDEASEIIRLCAREGVAVTPYGGGTGFCGGAVPGKGQPHIVLSLERMRAIRSLDTINNAIVAEAGCTLSQVRDAAAAADRLFPVSHGGEGSSQIGGMIATNAGGNNVLRYGMARAHVLGLEVVLADGTVWDGLRLLRKDNAGYDVKQLFIGSEGTLGVVTAAALALRPKPLARATALVAINDPQAALDLYLRLRASSGDLMSAFELVPRSGLDLHFARQDVPAEPFADRHEWMALIEFETAIQSLDLETLMEDLLAAAFEDGLVRDAAVARSQAQAAALWALREGMAEAQAGNVLILKSDTSVPLDAGPDFVRRCSAATQNILAGATPIPFGHVGDGNIHFNVMAPVGMDAQIFTKRAGELASAIEDIASALGGSIAAEHGLGQSKVVAAARAKPAAELHMMHRIKAALDPTGLFNPGKVISPTISETDGQQLEDET